MKLFLKALGLFLFVICGVLFAAWLTSSDFYEILVLTLVFNFCFNQAEGMDE